MRRLIRFVPFLAWSAAMLCAPVAGAQTAKPEPTYRDVLLKQWVEIGEKIVKMAEDFPDDQYEFRPVPGVRTFGDQMRHVAFWNGFVAKSARGERPDGALNELPKAQFATKASVVKALTDSLADATAQLKNGPMAPAVKATDLWVTFTEHAGEHYGQAVVYYRLNGLVPPASRGQ